MENKRYAVSRAFTWGEERYLNANIEEKIDADAKERLATELARMLKNEMDFGKEYHVAITKRKERGNAGGTFIYEMNITEGRAVDNPKQEPKPFIKGQR